MIKRSVLSILLAGLFASSGAFAFQPGMTVQAIDTEVQQRVTNKESMESIATDAQASGVAPGTLLSALVLAGKDTSAIVTALVAAGMPAQAVVNAGQTLGGLTQTAANNAAVSGNPNVATQLAGYGSTAAGGGQQGGGQQGGTAGNQANNSFNSGGASSFGTSRAGTVSGGSGTTKKPASPS